MGECAISIIGEKLVEYTIGPILHQLGYLFHYNKNIKDLKGKYEEVEDERVQHQVDEARSKGYEIESDVSKWLERVDEITAQSHTSQENQSGSNPSCFNLPQRYQQSRKAKKTMEEISEMIERVKMFNTVGHPVPLSGIGNSTMPRNYQFLESRTLMAKQITNALENPNVNKVGIYGMGGVGKTYLLNEVEKLVMEHKSLFDQVIKVTIGQTYSVEDIQTQISDKLRLDLKQLAQGKQGRADLLRNKLKMENKILIMLDDLWNELNLEDVGIPCRSNSSSSEKGCKILITGRNRDVLTKDMEVEHNFLVNFLEEDESWKMFGAIIGEINDVDIEREAKKVAKECGRLPLALVTVAKALKGKALPIWKDALNQLKTPIASNYTKGVTEKIYFSIKLSYNHIENKEAQSLFLLCSIFPDDYMISIKDLEMYAMGMELLNGVNTWNDTKNRVLKLVDDLISSSLLFETEDNSRRDKYVKMHDVVRDVAIHITSSKEANMRTLNYGYNLSEWREEDRNGSYRAIFCDCSSFQNLPPNLQFHNLELLIMVRSWMKKKLQISNTFFEGMEQLKVLVLSMMCFQGLRISLSDTLVNNLRIFCMIECEVDDINIIGELKKLEILKIQSCSITYLPTTMNGLTQLKVLEVSNCHNLEVIPQNILSSMTKLEELDLSCSSFNRWGEEVSYKDKLIKNATLSELKYLPLISLKLEILDENMLQDFLFLEKLKLEDYCFKVGDSTVIGFMDCARSLKLEIRSQIDLTDRVFGTLWQRCEDLYIKASECLTNFGFRTNENGYPGLTSQENSENAIPFFDDKVGFLELRDLRIKKVNNLKMLWHNNHSLIANSFCKLQTIDISDCKSLRYIFSSNVVISLVSLKSLTIADCESVERIFEMDEEPTCKHKDDAKVMMPLMTLDLSRLSILKCVWSKDPSRFLTFSNLEDIYIRDCPQLQSVLPASFINHIQKLETLSILNIGGVPYQIFSEDETSKLVFSEIVFTSLRYLKVSHFWESHHWFRSVSLLFPRLQVLKLSYCKDMIALPPEMNQTLYDIEELNVSNASKLVQVFQNEEENNNHTRRCANLKRLSLLWLPELTHVWIGSTGLAFSKLKHIDVIGCDKLMNLLSSSVAKSLVKLKIMSIYDCREMSCIVGRDEMEEVSDKIVFSKLVQLDLSNLPGLARFHSGKCRLEFPCLKKLSLCNLPELTDVWMGGTGFTFSNLEDLSVSSCDKLKILLSSSVAKSLVKLETMRIDYCQKLGCIVGRDEGEEDNDEIVFSKLVELNLKKLPRLESFHSGKCKLEFPCLEKLVVDECPIMNRFSNRIINTPQLRHLEIGQSKVPLKLYTKHDINVIFQHICLEDDCIQSIKYLFAQHPVGNDNNGRGG